MQSLIDYNILKFIQKFIGLASKQLIPKKFQITQIFTRMIPQQLKKMFGLNSQKDAAMANNIWKMLDEMSQNSPEQYKEFIKKNIKEGVQQVKQKKQQKNKPYLTKPQKGFLLEFDAILNQKYLPTSQTSQSSNLSKQLQQKLSITSQKWQDVKKKFKPKLHIRLNVLFSDRVKFPLDRNKKQLHNLTIDRVKEIQVLYYSLQGPKYPQKGNNEEQQVYYCTIFNRNMYESLMRQGVNGKKLIMSLAISYFEQRLQTDHNPLIKLYNPEVHKKLAFYALEKLSIQINNELNYFFNNSKDMEQFLLERQVDIIRQKQIQQEQKKIKHKIETQTKRPEIKFKVQEPKNQVLSNPSNDNIRQNNQSEITKSHLTHQPINQNNNKKKPLIQVLNSTQTSSNQPRDLPYELKETQTGFHVQILTPGIDCIDELQLEISDLKIKLKIIKTSQSVEIPFKTPINSDLAKAKLKKKINRLIVDAPFLSKL